MAGSGGGKSTKAPNSKDKADLPSSSRDHGDPRVCGMGEGRLNFQASVTLFTLSLYLAALIHILLLEGVRLVRHQKTAFTFILYLAVIYCIIEVKYYPSYQFDTYLSYLQY
jgi:hypothetical protein